MTATRCAICDALIGRDAGPPDGWQLEDGRTVCHACFVNDLDRLIADWIRQRDFANIKSDA